MLLLDVILSTIAIIVLAIASYCDIRRREVPDWLSYGLIFAALGIRLIFSITEGWQLFASGMLGFIACVLLALLFYYSHQWGGGDSKLLMGMGALVGITYPFNATSWNLLWFFLLLMLLGAIYGLCWVIGLAIIHRNEFLAKFKEHLYLYKNIHLGLGILSLAFFLVFLWSSGKGYSFIWPLVPFPLTVFYLFLFVTSVENSCFVKKVGIETLTEGDWLADDVFVDAHIFMKRKTLESDDLEKLKKMQEEKKLHKVLIREGIPFVPSFLLAYLAVEFLGPQIVRVIESFI